jgi:peptidyl-Lys metalloendopeptidase
MYAYRENKPVDESRKSVNSIHSRKNMFMKNTQARHSVTQPPKTIDTLRSEFQIYTNELKKDHRNESDIQKRATNLWSTFADMAAKYKTVVFGGSKGELVKEWIKDDLAWQKKNIDVHVLRHTSLKNILAEEKRNQWITWENELKARAKEDEYAGYKKRDHPKFGQQDYPGGEAYTDPARIKALRKAGHEAEKKADKAKNLVKDNNQSKLVKRWFGSFTDVERNNIANNYEKIKNHISAKNTKDDYYRVPERKMLFSTDTLRTFAYVYPREGDKMYISDAFWLASLNSGFDTRYGTMIHETSHFKSVAGTRDFKYGYSQCINLAKKHPRKAKRNADNYEYFAEYIF